MVYFLFVVSPIVASAGLLWLLACVEIEVAQWEQREKERQKWAESLEFGQTLEANQGFYKGHEFQITGISPIKLNGPVELTLTKSEAYEMFKETK